MAVLDAFAIVLVGLAAVATTARGGAGAPDAKVRADLETLARRTVLFGHQSVGMNVVDGLVTLAKEHGASLRAVDVSAKEGPLAPGTLGHAFLAANGDPEGKLDEFARRMSSPGTTTVDVALVKLCFVDFDGGGDAAALFASYQRTVERIRAARPKVTLVHVTTPLTAVQTGPKAWAKRLLGRPPYGVAENARREAYNSLLRQAYAGEPMFDLARVESTRPDGSAEAFDWDGRSIPALVPEYSDDGAHLNDAGRRRAARALLAILAATAPRR